MQYTIGIHLKNWTLKIEPGGTIKDQKILEQLTDQSLKSEKLQTSLPCGVTNCTTAAEHHHRDITNQTLWEHNQHDVTDQSVSKTHGLLTLMQSSSIASQRTFHELYMKCSSAHTQNQFN